MLTPRPRFGGFWRLGALLGLLALALGQSACNTASSEAPKYFAQFFLEAPDRSGVPFTMPKSGLQYYRVPDPFLNSADVTAVNAGTVDVSGQRTLCVFFQFSALGTRELYMQSANNVGRRIFLFVNGKPMGARLIDQVIQTGQLFVFIEIGSDKELMQFVTDLQSSLQKINEIKNKQ